MKMNSVEVKLKVFHSMDSRGIYQLDIQTTHEQMHASLTMNCRCFKSTTQHIIRIKVKTVNKAG